MLVTVNVVVALCLLSAFTVAAYVQFRFGQISTVSIASLRNGGSTVATEPFTMVVVGSDSRALGGTDTAQFGTVSQAPGQRSDTILLVRVVPATRSLAILSIPRDLWVPVAGLGQQRINAAFGSGPNLLVSTIQSDLGIPIDHYVEVNFNTFRQISDAIGGVRFYFPTPAQDLFSNLVVPTAGCISLTGDQALAFVRSRHYQYYQGGEWHPEGLSDLARIQRQQAFVKRLIKKAKSEYTNPVALNAILGGITKNLTVDRAFTTNMMLSLAKQLRSVDPAAIGTQTIPTFDENVGGAQVLGLQQPQAAHMIAAFNTLGTSSAAGSPTTANPGPTSIASTTTFPPVPPSSMVVEVTNGTGVNGQAGLAARELVGLGYPATVNPVAGHGSATNVIRYAPDSEAGAAQLRSQLLGGADLLQDASLTPTRYNLQLITGTSFRGVTSGSAAGTQSSATSSPTTSAPTQTAVTPYVLPGALPGTQPPASCQG